MFVRVAQLYEAGRPLPRHRAITAQPVHIGRLTLYEEHSQEFRRSMVFARLCAPVAGEDPLPRLHDAVVRFISDRCMTIGGFERDSVTGECRAQSWYVQLVDDADGPE